MKLFNNYSIADKNKTLYKIIYKSNSFDYTIHSFLPKEYWQKRGLYVLLKHPAITYIRLPDSCKQEPLPKISKEELQACFNPITIAKALEKEQAQWLDFYIKHEFGIEAKRGGNPFTQKEFLQKLIKQKLSVLNHGKTNDVNSRYIMPLKNILQSLQRFPNKLEKAKPIVENLQSSFFESYEIVQILFLLQGYKNEFGKLKDNDTLKIINLNTSMVYCKSITLNNDKEKHVAQLSLFFSNFTALIHN